MQRDIGAKKKEFIEGGTVGNTKVTFKDFLKEKFDAVIAVRDQKKKINK